MKGLILLIFAMTSIVLVFVWVSPVSEDAAEISTNGSRKFLLDKFSESKFPSTDKPLQFHNQSNPRAEVVSFSKYLEFEIPDYAFAMRKVPNGVSFSIPLENREEFDDFLVTVGVPPKGIESPYQEDLQRHLYGHVGTPSIEKGALMGYMGTFKSTKRAGLEYRLSYPEDGAVSNGWLALSYDRAKGNVLIKLRAYYEDAQWTESRKRLSPSD